MLPRMMIPHVSSVARPALVVSIALVAACLWNPSSFMQLATRIGFAFSHVFGDGVLWLSSGLLLGLLLLAMSPVGAWKLGAANSQPEFHTLSWLAMLFAAGMGAGLMFWGAAEPLMHFDLPPDGWGEGSVRQQIAESLALSYFHWTFHPWAIYAASGLAVAYFRFCRRHPLMPSSSVQPLLQSRQGKWARYVSRLLDILALTAVIIGMAASISQGVIQLAAGVKWIVPQWADTLGLQSMLAWALGGVALLSATTPLGKGIQILSVVNILLAILLMLAVIGLMSWEHVATMLRASMSTFMKMLPELSFQLQDSGTASAGIAKRPWGEKWTVVYLLSWIAWTPFVATFIARISRGRTIRQFIAGVVLVPSLFSILWFAAFGGFALQQELLGAPLVAQVQDQVGDAVFMLFAGQEYPLFWWVWVWLLVFLFLVTSADSAAYVLASMAHGGEATPSAARKLTWGGLLTLLVSGVVAAKSGITGVRALVSTGAIPLFFLFFLQMAGLCVALWRDRNNRNKRTDTGMVTSAEA